MQHLGGGEVEVKVLSFSSFVVVLVLVVVVLVVVLLVVCLVEVVLFQSASPLSLPFAFLQDPFRNRLRI